MARLLNGDEIADDALVFDDRTYHVFAGSTDVTNAISRAEKQRIFGSQFDEQRDNFRMSDERRLRNGQSALGLEARDTGVIGPTIDALITDPFGAPIESLSNKANQFFGASGIIKLLIFGALIFAAYVAFTGGWLKRRL